MENNEIDSMLLLGALENVLGKGHRRARQNYAFVCPFCSHYKPKLEVNLDANSPYFGYWECWVCGEKGRTIKSLLKHMKISSEEAYQVLQFVQKGTGEKQVNVPKSILRLPDEFQPLWLAEVNSISAIRAKNYLYARGLNDNDFIKYGIGYCTKGKYENRVIIPSYDENNMLNYFVARSLDPEAYLKYINPEAHKDDIVCFENLIDWKKPVIICEGVFDAMAIRRNCTCLLGKRMSKALIQKLIENPVHQVFLVLDQDAKKTAIDTCEELLRMGKQVYFVTPPKKDPSETGFELMTETLQHAEELTLRRLVELRLGM